MGTLTIILFCIAGVFVLLKIALITLQALGAHVRSTLTKEELVEIDQIINGLDNEISITLSQYNIGQDDQTIVVTETATGKFLFQATTTIAIIENMCKLHPGKSVSMCTSDGSKVLAPKVGKYDKFDVSK